ncbi:MAG: peptide ABC transporter substrate-binding protein [Planctomycetes bacterium]|nr:peptide ABC transporter substrate-binding protein [Planctomycetota bacterium]
MQLRSFGPLAALLILTSFWAGCGSDSKPGKAVSEAGAPAATASSPAPAVAAKPAEPAPDEMAERRAKFVPPATLAEVDKAAGGWTDNELIDGIARLRQQQAAAKPLVDVATALKLKNDSSDANTKIASALGQLPANDKEVDYEATWTHHLKSEIKSTNPIMFNSVEEGDLASLTAVDMFALSNNMVSYGSKETLVSWQTSKDHLLDKVVLRDDLTWSDGKPITAHDIEFSFRMILDPKVPIPAVRTGVDKLLCVKAYDAQTVVYFHPEAQPINHQNINFPFLPKHVYEKTYQEDPTLVTSAAHHELERHPLSGNAYVVTKHEPNQEFVLERRESYYTHNGKQVRDKPYFKRIVFKIIPNGTTALLSLKKGDVDDLQLTPEDWHTKTNDDDFYARNTKVRAPEWTYAYFGWNCRRPYFTDVRVRRAMSLAFNYREMLDKLCYGLYQQSRGIFHAGAWMAANPMPEPYTQDLDRAESLLDEAGWTDSDGDGVRDKLIDGKRVPFEFTLLCYDLEPAKGISTLMKDCLEQIGVKCNVRTIERTTLIALELEHNYDAAFGAWGTGSDPYTLENIFATGEGRNFGLYSNPEVDRLFEQGKKEFDRQKRAAIYAQIHRVVWEDQPYTFLYSRSSFYAFNKQLRGYNFSPRGPFHFTPGINSIWRVAE